MGCGWIQRLVLCLWLIAHREKLGILDRKEDHDSGVKSQENNYYESSVFTTEIIRVDVIGFILIRIDVFVSPIRVEVVVITRV